MNIIQQLKLSQKRPNFLFSIYLELAGMRALYVTYMLHKHQRHLAYLSHQRRYAQQQPLTGLPS